jgi:hypothetical protein
MGVKRSPLSRRRLSNRVIVLCCLKPDSRVTDLNVVPAAVHHPFSGAWIMMNDQLLSPDELFRRYQRGMLDQQSMFSQILLNMIELSERQQQHAVLLEMITAALGGLSRDVAALAELLGMARPSQAGPEADEAAGDEADEDQNSEADEAAEE